MKLCFSGSSPRYQVSPLAQVQLPGILSGSEAANVWAKSAQFYPAGVLAAPRAEQKPLRRPVQPNHTHRLDLPPSQTFPRTGAGLGGQQPGLISAVAYLVISSR